MFKKLYFLTFFVFVLSIFSSVQATPISFSVESSVEAIVGNDGIVSPSKDYDSKELQAIDSTNRRRVSLVSFDISGIKYEDQHFINMSLSLKGLKADDVVVYGVVEDQDNISESLSWNSAPGVKAAQLSFPIELDMDDLTGVVASFKTPGRDDTVTISSDALTDLLANDTDGTVTLLIAPKKIGDYATMQSSSYPGSDGVVLSGEVSWGGLSSLAGYWSLDEGDGLVAADSSGYGNDGELYYDDPNNTPVWVAGQMGSALEFNGVGGAVVIPPAAWAGISNEATLSLWAFGNVDLLPAQTVAFAATASGERGFRCHLPYSNSNVYFDAGGSPTSGGYDRLQVNGVSADIYEGTWSHWAFVKNADTGELIIYLNGEQFGYEAGNVRPVPGDEIDSFVLGASESFGNPYPGILDDVQLYSEALPAGAVQQIMDGPDAPMAYGPSPADGAVDVLRDGTVLSWKSGEMVVSHDVYVGTDPNALVFMGNHAENTYALDRLELGVTYFWRIDEVDATAAVTTGVVWSFEAEPEAIMIDNALVTASATSQSSPEEDPNNVINGSGLNADGTHGQDITTMWLSGASAPGAESIRLDLPALSKLDEMLVWNHNSDLEADLGYGIKDALIEVSADGINFTSLGTVELLQAAETIVDMQGAVALSVKITAQSNWGGLIPKFGLSEVRFMAIPTVVREMSPADGASNQNPLATLLTWRAGREADVHEVYVDVNEQFVIDGTAAVVTVPENIYVPALDLDTTYFWRVDEVNNLEDPNVWAGPVQSFSTAATVAVEDMESATLVYSGEVTAAIVNNNDWSAAGIKSLSLTFTGNVNNVPGQLYVMVNDTRFDYQGEQSDLQSTSGYKFTIDLSGITVVDSLTIGVDGGSGTLEVDNIILTAAASELVIPVVPEATDLFASYEFEGDYTDSSGNGNDGTPVGDANIVDDAVRGQVLIVDGDGDCVDLGPSGDANQGFNPAGSFTVSAWINLDHWDNRWGHAFFANRGESNVGWQIRKHNRTDNLTFTVRGTDAGDDIQGSISMSANAGTWINVTGVYDAEAGMRSVYVNGLIDMQAVDGGVCAPTTHKVYIGARDDGSGGIQNGFVGMIDDVKFYSRALSQAEALGLSGRTAALYK